MEGFKSYFRRLLTKVTRLPDSNGTSTEEFRELLKAKGVRKSDVKHFVAREQNIISGGGRIKFIPPNGRWPVWEDDHSAGVGGVETEGINNL